MSKIARSQELLNLNPDDINRMTAQQLRAAVSILASAANKRLARLGATGIGQISPAYLAAQKRAYTGAAGGKFGTKGKTRNQLLNEYKAIKSFMSAKTSSVTSWREYRQRTYKRAGIEMTDDPEKEKAFWKTYRKIEEMYPTIKGAKSGEYGSRGVQSDLHRVMAGKARWARGVIDTINAHNLENRDFVVDDETGEVYQTDELPQGDFVIDDTGKLTFVDVTDSDDALYIMELKVGVEYERTQNNDGSGEFFELPDKRRKK